MVALRVAESMGRSTGASAAFFKNPAHGRSKRYTYYRCRSCRLSVRTAKTHAIFEAWLETLVPVPGFLALVRDRVVAALGDDESRLARERAVAQDALTEVERNLDTLTRRALRGAEAFDAGTVKRLRTELETRKLACQVAVNDLTCDVLDVEATLAYAEHVLTHLPSLWRDCAPTHRQALGRVLFPARVQFDGVSCQTTSWAFGLNGLEGFLEAGLDLVDLTGIEPVTS
jgi:hypothetical protein